jgi:hypothetical protein
MGSERIVEWCDGLRDLSHYYIDIVEVQEQDSEIVQQ